MQAAKPALRTHHVLTRGSFHGNEWSTEELRQNMRTDNNLEVTDSVSWSPFKALPF